MRPLLTDQDFDERIVRGLVRALGPLDVVAARDLGLAEAPDDQVLETGALLGRIVLSHDARTMPPTLYERVARGDPVPTLVLVPRAMSVGRAVEQLAELIGGTSDGEELAEFIRLPL